MGWTMRLRDSVPPYVAVLGSAAVVGAVSAVFAVVAYRDLGQTSAPISVLSSVENRTSAKSHGGA